MHRKWIATISVIVVIGSPVTAHSLDRQSPSEVVQRELQSVMETISNPDDADSDKVMVVRDGLLYQWDKVPVPDNSGTALVPDPTTAMLSSSLKFLPITPRRWQMWKIVAAIIVVKGPEIIREWTSAIDEVRKLFQGGAGGQDNEDSSSVQFWSLPNPLLDNPYRLSFDESKILICDSASRESFPLSVQFVFRSDSAVDWISIEELKMAVCDG